MPGTTRAAFILQDYLNKKTLATLGYSFAPDSLESWEVEAYSVISNTLAGLEKKDMEKNSKRRGK